MLRDYQVALLDKISRAYYKHNRVCLQLQTGGGKTIIACTYALQQPEGQQAIFLVHREELAEQTMATLTTYGINGKLGYITTKRAMTPWAKIHVAMAQTLYRRMDKLPWLNPSLIIVDECHHVRAKTWEMILQQWPHAKLLGLTATPARLDGKGLAKWFDRLIIGPSYETLVEKKALAPIKMFSLPVGINLSGCKLIGGDYSKHDVDERITEKVIADSVKNTLKFCGRRQFIHYAFNIRQSKEYADKMKQQGMNVEHIDGTLSHQARRAIIDRYRRGVTQGLSNCALINEGFDVPETDAVILGMRTQSQTLFRQACGRASRPKKNSRHGIIIDLAGNYNTHGRPDEEIRWSLEDGIEDQEKTPQKDYSICENCGYIKSRNRKECEACGHIRETDVPMEVEVELREIGPSVSQAPPITHKKLSQKASREIGKRVEQSLGDEEALDDIIKEYGLDPKTKERWRSMWCVVWDKKIKQLWPNETPTKPSFTEQYGTARELKELKQ